MDYTIIYGLVRKSMDYAIIYGLVRKSMDFAIIYGFCDNLWIKTLWPIFLIKFIPKVKEIAT